MRIRKRGSSENNCVRGEIPLNSFLKLEIEENKDDDDDQEEEEKEEEENGDDK